MSSKREAIAYARAAADACDLPMTVYRSPDIDGWEYTNALSGRLWRAELAVTVLPARYFT